MLVDHADAGGDGVAWARELNRLLVNQDLAGVGLIKPIEDVHQGGLACAVLTQQAKNLAIAHLEADVVVSEHTRKALGYTPKFQLHAVAYPSR